MKKLISILIILSMIMSLSLPAFSAEKTDGKKILVDIADDIYLIMKKVEDKCKAIIYTPKFKSQIGLLHLLQ